LLYRKRNTLTKKLSFLQIINIIVTKIKIIKTITEKTKTIKTITEITETTKTLVIIEYTDNLITTTDLENVVISVRKRIINYRNI
jgi:hypothetical protein